MIQNIQKILAPIDFSDFSMQAMRGAWELATDVAAEMHLVYVVAPHNTFVPLPLATDAERTRELARESAMLQQADEELARIKKAEFDDSKKIVTAALKGPPVDKLVEYAVQQDIDLIVLATHGRTGAQHIFIGSVAERLARLAPCSVLVLRRRQQ
ncbi:MAG TPA: universal stress protein [Candidatus Binataceae bacterium]